jgi:hypothetical protein
MIYKPIDTYLLSYSPLYVYIGVYKPIDTYLLSYSPLYVYIGVLNANIILLRMG